MITLCIRRPDKPENRFEIDPGIYTIGTDEANKIVLPGKEISWRHAILSFMSDGVWVEDLKSRTGTIVDGQFVHGRMSIRPGQIINIGHFAITYENGDAMPVPEPPAVAKPGPEYRPPAPQPEVQRPAPEPAPIADSTLPSQRTAPREEPTRLQAALEVNRGIKRQIQQELILRLDLKRMTTARVGEKDLREKVQKTVADIVQEVRGKLPPGVDPNRLTKEIFDEAVGLGPIEDLLADPEVTEIMVNGCEQVYIERKGRIELSGMSFVDNDSVAAIIERIVSPIGRRIDESSPYVDARLPDGSRVNAIIHPLSLTGPCLTIRKFSKDPFKVSDLVKFNSLTDQIADFLSACVRLKKNIIVSGGTGTGKTTLLNVVSSFIPVTERVITIEDSAELRLGQPHVIRLEARPPNIEGRGAITIRDLVRNALRMRPDRIVVGEVRGGEALDMLQAMNTGHEGSLTTVHANTPRDVISRLETMVLMSGMDLPVRAIREQIGAAIHLIVHISRFSDGTRKVARISEVCGLESDQITMQDIFQFKQTTVDQHGKVIGKFEPTGSVPTFVEEMASRGIKIDHAIFDPARWA
jgi:pilus assembly protein CpaF